ncbi:hypothetical protein PRIPAC_95952, partial [Pristionchus pacificus]|uniref:Uncharacterized protein n=1 Tax=Pristionchus pacificus TaxID=54126 RepID=A0A2A6BC96_PRIPA
IIHFEPQSPSFINILYQLYVLPSFVLKEIQLLALIQMRMNLTEESNYLVSSRFDHSTIDLSSLPQFTIRKNKEDMQIKSAVNFMCDITSYRNRRCDLCELEFKFSFKRSFILDSDDSDDSDC